MSKDDQPSYPTRSSISEGRELSLIAAEAAVEALGQIPFVGPATKFILQQIIPDELESRRADWAFRTIEAIKTIEAKQSAFLKTDEFMSLYIRATEEALRNHQKEKLDALQACLSNADSKLSFDEKDVLMQIMRDLTVLDLKLLAIIFGNTLRPTIRQIGGAEIISNFSQDERGGRREKAEWVYHRLEQQFRLVEKSVRVDVRPGFISMTWLGLTFCVQYDVRAP